MKVLSLFDGMACGMLAMRSAGVDVTDYDAYEIDKYAIQVAKHNFPGIREHGDVFMKDFTRYKGVDFVVGGSPCTYWSIAQSKDKRETEAHGIGWELFRQYVRAVREAEPRYFIYENNKSMADAIRREISETFGFEPICINSALVSAQNRQRLYWVGVRNADGSYRKADIEQPDDRGILLKDILESGENLTGGEKSFCLTTRCQGAIPDNTIERGQHTMVAEPIRVGSLPRPNGELSTSQAMRVYSDDGKAVGLKACGRGMGGKTGLYAIPCESLSEEYYKGGYDGNLIWMIENEGSCRGGSQPTKQYRVYSSEGKSVCVDSSPQKHYIVPNENDKQEPIYEVKDGKITIKGKQYPIKLADGQYMIRKLTVDECKRLQTVPEDYDMTCISNTQAYKCLGNGWTIEVIAHLIRGALRSAESRTPRTLDDWAEVCA